MTAGIKTETTIEIDWYSLGQNLAHLTSGNQSAFMDGFAAGLHGLGAVDSAHQIQYVANGVHGYSTWLVEELSSALALRAGRTK